MKKLKVLVICPYPEGVAPSQRLKYEQYFESWREAGIEIHVASFMSLTLWKIVHKPGNTVGKIVGTLVGYCKRIGQLIQLRRYDVVYISLWVTPFGTSFFEWMYTAISKRVIYDIDDLIFLRPVSSANPLAHLFKSGRKMITLMKRADHVITCTPYLDQFVRKYTNHTSDISSTINTTTYKPNNSYLNNKQLVLGWSGSYTTSKYLHLLSDVLRRLKKKYNIQILVIGDEKFHIDGLDIEAIPWREQTEVQDLQRIDIGLYPLPNEEWVLGKSGLKALQYMSLGIPTVATKIGANHRVIEDGVSGFLVDSYEEWEMKLSVLIEDSALRKNIGGSAVERVEKFYSVNANKSIYLDILNQITK